MKFAILSDSACFTSNSLVEIEKRVKQLHKKRKIAKIYYNGRIIGWIDEDLSNITGWGYYIDKSKIDMKAKVKNSSGLMLIIPHNGLLAFSEWLSNNTKIKIDYVVDTHLNGTERNCIGIRFVSASNETIQSAADHINESINPTNNEVYRNCPNCGHENTKIESLNPYVCRYCQGEEDTEY